MSDARYHPAVDPILQGFKQHWKTSIDEIIQDYLNDKISFDKIINRIQYPLPSDKSNINDSITKLESKEDKNGLSPKKYLLLGCLFYYTKNYKKAENYFNLAKNNDGLAEIYLGNIHNIYELKPFEFEKAQTYYREAAKHGNQSIFLQNLDYGYILKKDIGLIHNEKDALNYYLQAAELDNPVALARLGYAYRNRLVNKDTDRAIVYYERSAKLGNIEALYRLGIIYREKGGAVNEAKAAAYFRYAGEKDHFDALMMLEGLYNENTFFYTDRTAYVSYHAAIILNKPDVLNKIALKNPDIFDELLRDDDWNKIKPLLKDEVLQKVVDRNSDYFAQEQYLLEEKTKLPSGVSNLILSFAESEDLLKDTKKDIQDKTQMIREKEKLTTKKGILSFFKSKDIKKGADTTQSSDIKQSSETKKSNR